MISGFFLRSQIKEFYQILCLFGLIIISPAILADNIPRPHAVNTELSVYVETLFVELNLTSRISHNYFIGIGSGAGAGFRKVASYNSSHLTGGSILEIARVSIFFTRRKQQLYYSAGLTPSFFLHFDDSDDDPGGGVSFSAFGMIEYAFNRGPKNYFRIGTRVELSYLNEGVHVQRIGVTYNPIPISLRLVLPF